MPASAIKSIFSGLLGRDVTSVKRIGGGRNSQIYRLTCGRSATYAGKLYFRHGSDDRDRLDVEFSSLQFLWENRIRCIPQPIGADREHGYAVYEYVDGRKISAPEVTDSDIDYAVQFLARLKQLKSRKKSWNFPPASEACFSVQAIVNNIELRLNRLSAIQNGGAQYQALHKFLANNLTPAYTEIIKWCQSTLSQSEISFAADLGPEERMLSPSDFGFHNALRRSDGRIIFLDFEYFGWDDPAKMVSDFLLHPAMELSAEHKRRFLSGILNRFGDCRYLDRRVESVYPLFGLKWCLILLNEFIPEELLRRGFASKSELNINDLQTAQLSKARIMLSRIRRDYENFPYRA